ncbi:ABC transporter ATP-binding protein [Kitasatospora kazusensis]|uniref:ABC transporter ATP-binding protein n=1 Tax=Kitasatospora kazusensis TaxID=407974 RepID=A0ABP5KD84_9ACTN
MMNSSPVAAPPAIRVTGLTVTRGGNPVLQGLSLDVAAGSITGLLGPSGCGKTTLLRSIVGVQKTTAGRVEVLGAEAGSAVLRRRVGYVTQAPSVYGDLSVAENLRYFAAVLGAPADDPARVIAQVGLSAHRETLTARLSGGQRARVSLAAALLGSPELLVLDEPTVGLDPVLRQELWQLFRQLADAGATLLVSSHVMDEAARCDRLLLMREGRLLADDTPAELLSRTGAADVDSAFLALVAGPAPAAAHTPSAQAPSAQVPSAQAPSGKSGTSS